MSRGLRAIVGVIMLVVAYFVPAAAPYLVSTGIGLIVGAALEKTPRKLRRLLEQTVMVRSAVAPQEIVYGRTRKSGVVTWYDANGPKNKYLWFVITVCEHEIDGFEKLWIDNEEIDIDTQIDGSGFVTHSQFVDSDGNYLVKTGFYTGTDTQTADSDLVSSTSYWTSDHKGEGVCYFWVRLEIDASKGGTDPEQPGVNVWAKGWPRDLSVVIRGKKIYDPRLDSTQIIDSTTSPVTYGSGSHRLDSPSTWEWSNNSVLVRADYIKSTRFGPGYTYDDIDWETVAKEADKADTLVDIPGSATQAQWTIDGIVTTDDQPKQILEGLQSADHGTTLFLPSGIKIYTGAWNTPSLTIDKSWLAGAFTATSSTPADNNYNAVRGQYLNADENYTLTGFQPMTSSAYETEDGDGTKWTDIALSYTSNEYRAQRIAIIELKKSRLQTSITVECGPIAEQVEIHDTVYVDLPGYSSDDSPSGVITCRVTSKISTSSGITTLSLKEEKESDWTYEVSDLVTPPVVSEVTRGDGTIDPPTNLTATTYVNGIGLEWLEPNYSSPQGSLANIDYYELWASATNNRSNATVIARTTMPGFMHFLSEGTERYYWVRSRSNFGYSSNFEPAGSTNGVYGIAGAPGADGDTGSSILRLSVYKRALDSSPATVTTPSVGSGSYNFTTGVLTPPSGWSVDVPTSNGFPLWETSSTFQTTNGDFVGASPEVVNDNLTLWSTPAIVSQDGAGGYGSLLTNPSPIIYCDEEGFNYGHTTSTSPKISGDEVVNGSSGTFKVYKGGVDITGTISNMYDQGSSGGWTSDAYGRSKYTDNGLEFYIDKDDGTYRCEVSDTYSWRAWTGDSLSLTLKVLVDDTVSPMLYHEQTFTIAKTKSRLNFSVIINNLTPYGYNNGLSTYAGGIRYDSNGGEYTITGYGASPTWTDTGDDWLQKSESSSFYDIFVTQISGDTPTYYDNFDEWLSLGSDRDWYYDTTSAKSGVLKVSIRRNSTGEVLRTEFVNITTANNPA